VRLANGEFARTAGEADEILAHALGLGARTDAVEASLLRSAVLRAQADAAGTSPIGDLLATATRVRAESSARNLAPRVRLERAPLLARTEDAPLRRSLLERAHGGLTRRVANGRPRGKPRAGRVTGTAAALSPFRPA